jgi:hypothetical protein
MADVRKILIEIDADTGNVVGGIGQVNKQLSSLGASAKLATKEVSQAAKAMQKDLAGSAGIAGAAATELGRTISDLPFGITAVTNNISQLGNMFALLVTSAGGVGKALTAMRTALMGPVGILVAFQAVVAGIEMFAQRSKKAKEEAVDFNIELEAQVAALNAVSEAFRSSNASEAKRIDLLEKNKQLGKEILEGYKQQKLTAEEVAKLADLENGILKSKEALQKSAKDTQAERKALEAELLEISEKEESTQKRKFNLMRKGMTEEEAINEINRARVGFFGGQEAAATSFVALAKQRGEVEEKINQLMEGQQEALDGIVKAEREAAKLRALAEMRASAEKELLDEKLDLEEDLLNAELNRLRESETNTLEAQREVQSKIYSLNVRRIEEQEKRELEGITDKETIRLIKEKYKVISDAAALDFRKALETTLDTPIEVKLKPAIIGEDLLDGPEQTEAQKIATEALNKVGKAAQKGLKERVESEGDRNIFVDMFGISQEKFEETAKQVQQGLNATFDLIDAQFERELALEETKTIALNDQLRERLRNEQLTAEARDAINQEIAKNDAELVEKQNAIEKKRFQLNKAQGVANAIVNTALGVSQALSTANIPLATFIGALGAAQVATIMAQTFTPKAMPSPNLTAQGAGGEGGLAPSFNVVGATAQNQIAAAVSAAIRETPVRSYVVSSDVTTAQQLDRNIIQGATI